jgi:hypothetical protein
MSEKAGEKNIYTCNLCKGHIITVNLVDGTTPMFLPCKATPNCGGEMQSSWYMNVPDEPPTHEWFKPTDFKIYPKRIRAGMKEHVGKGGLDIRPITQADSGPITDDEIQASAEAVAGLIVD